MMINKIINEYSIADWEETSFAYCQLMLAKTRNAEAVVICEELEWKISAIKRYLSNMGIKIQKIYTKSELQDNSQELKKLSELEFADTIIVLVDGIRFNVEKNKIRRNTERHFLRREYYRYLDTILSKAIKVSFPYWRERREQIFLYAKEHVEELNALAESLADEESRETLCELIRCSTENDVYRNAEGKQDNKYWECYKHLENEDWVNCGSAVGDTIIKYIDKGFSYSKIYAFEGNPSEFEGLKKIVSSIGSDKIELVNEFIGVEQSEENFDHRFENTPISLINMDIEGAEMGVLRGAKKIIEKWRPVLAICTYHKTSDLLDIPKLIRETAPDYSIYLRKYRGYEPNALNEYLYYAVPKERQVKE